jgi:hypothetical protein
LPHPSKYFFPYAFGESTPEEKMGTIFTISEIKKYKEDQVGSV